MWDLPFFVEINGKKHPIRNKCDYRVILDVICALNDNDLTDEEKIKCALFIFYDNLENIMDFETATQKMFQVINLNEEEDLSSSRTGIKLMDWEHDFNKLAPPISRVLGYDVRTPDKYCHWFSFIGAYMEIGECQFSTIVSIRQKIAKGKKLEKWEEEYRREHYKEINLPKKLTQEEKELLSIFKGE